MLELDLEHFVLAGLKCYSTWHKLWPAASLPPAEMSVKVQQGHGRNGFQGRGWEEKLQVFLSPQVYVTVPSLLSCSPLSGFALVPVCPVNAAHLISEVCPLRFLSSIGVSELYAKLLGLVCPCNLGCCCWSLSASPGTCLPLGSSSHRTGG